VQVAVADLLPAHRRLAIETRRSRGRLMTRRRRTATGSCSWQDWPPSTPWSWAPSPS